MWPQGWYGQKPRNASSQQKLEKASNRLSHGASIRNLPCWVPDLGSVKLILDFLASRNIGDKTSAVLSHQAMAPFYSSHRKPIECYINFLVLPQQSTANWMTKTTEIYFHTVLKARSPRSWFQHPLRVESPPCTSQPLVVFWQSLYSLASATSPHLCLSLHGILPVCGSFSKFSLFIRINVVLDKGPP